MIKVFIDGREGTSGLQIEERLSARPDVQLLSIPPEKRKDTLYRRDYLNKADIAFLCLPDEAAKESVILVENSDTIIIDASTAHRTNPNWTYGLPEISPEQRKKISQSKRIANPGCHATGFILCVYPLIANGLVTPNSLLTCTSLTGYSGGGKALINRYETEQKNEASLKTNNLKLLSPRPYALGLKHKHLPEIKAITGLDIHFYPVVGAMRQGMLVSVPLFTAQLNGNPCPPSVHELLADWYQTSSFVKLMPLGADTCLDEGFLDPSTCNGSNRIELFVFGNESQILLIARLDNLGKGASGAAVQNMNITFGLPEDLYLQ